MGKGETTEEEDVMKRREMMGEKREKIGEEKKENIQK